MNKKNKNIIIIFSVFIVIVILLIIVLSKTNVFNKSQEISSEIQPTSTTNTITTTQTAATTTQLNLSKPKSLTYKIGVYYDYIAEHNIQGGDCYSVQFNWDEVESADGYVITTYWAGEGDTYKKSIKVKKIGEKYSYTAIDNDKSPTDVKMYDSLETMVTDNFCNKYQSKNLSLLFSASSAFYSTKAEIYAFKIIDGNEIKSDIYTLDIGYDY